MLGVPGLIGAWRKGNVTLANAVGTGVADDKAIYAYMPRIIRYYLDQDPILPIVETHICREPDGLLYTLDRLDELVVKPVGESGGYGITIGPRASRAELDDGARRAAEGPGQLDQPAGDRPVGRADPDRTGLAPAPSGPAPVRRHRAQHLGAARRAVARRAEGGQPGGQLLAGRRIEGHLGAGGGLRTMSQDQPLLARYAEGLFWMARYLERVENLARLIDVTQTFESPGREAEAWYALVRINADEAGVRQARSRARPGLGEALLPAGARQPELDPHVDRRGAAERAHACVR